ncbi:MAG: GNAT family N-acetyltransferase [bacterium]|nr:GNAT family N-acetyltransferase [bacterium]MCP5069303.1 GNAT family N-acetyltransferase [bacterium]
MLPSDGSHPPIAAPLPNVDTERLELRRFEEGDLDELARVFSHREVWQFPYDRALSRDETAAFLETQIREWDTYGFGCWIAIEKARASVIGYLGISVPAFVPEILPAVEVGWRLEPAAWGKGYASEGAVAALTEAFSTLQLDEVCSLPQAINPASAAVCERIGMRLERTIKFPANDRRGELDGLLYKITREEFQPC